MAVVSYTCPYETGAPLSMNLQVVTLFKGDPLRYPLVRIQGP